MKPYAAAIPFGKGRFQKWGCLQLLPETLQGAQWEVARIRARGVPARLVVVRIG